MTVLLSLGALVVAFVAGVLLSQKIKDKITGIPAALRADLQKAEADAVAKLKAKL